MKNLPENEKIKGKPLKIFINPNSGIPIYIQIAESILADLMRGIIKEGDKLPGVRELAVQIPANPNTVAKAYQKLIADGILEYRRGIGTFVKKVSEPSCEVRKNLKFILKKAKSKGIPEETLIQWIKEEYEK